MTAEGSGVCASGRCNRDAETSNADLQPILPARKVHSYAASFGDDLARACITKHTSRKEILLDPFAGSGTALLQARLLGRGAIGIDVDPIACLVSRVLIASYAPPELNDLDVSVTAALSSIERELSQKTLDGESFKPGTQFAIDGCTAIIPAGDHIEFWFSPVQRALLAALVQLANSVQSATSRDLLRLAISSSIIRKWPHTLSQARDIDHSRPHRVARSEVPLSSQVQIFLRAFKLIINTLRRLNAVSQADTVSLRVIQGDSAAALEEFEPCSIDYVLTSPPYFNAIDYPRAHKFAQWWLWPEDGRLTRARYLGLRSGCNDLDLTQRCAGLVPAHMWVLSLLRENSRSMHAAFCRYVIDIDNVITGLFSVLRPGKTLTFVIANNHVQGLSVPVVQIVTNLLETNGFNQVNSEERHIRANRRRYPYGISGFRGLMHTEYIIQATKSS